MEASVFWLSASEKASAFAGFLLPESFGLLDFQLLKPQPRPTFSIANPGSE